MCTIRTLHFGVSFLSITQEPGGALHFGHEKSDNGYSVSSERTAV